MKKLLGILVLSLLLSGNAYAKDLRLICTSEEGKLDVVTIIIGKGKAIMLFLNERLTTGWVKTTPNFYEITGDFVSTEYKNIGTYKYKISRHSGNFSNEILIGNSDFGFESNWSGNCKEDKVKF